MEQNIEKKEGVSLSDYKRFILAGDIGGTNARIAIVGISSKKQHDILLKQTCKTKDITDFSSVLNDFLRLSKEELDVNINIACLGVAGPLTKTRDHVKFINAPLEINVSEILPNTMLSKIILINDFESVSYGIDLLDCEKDAITVRKNNNGKKCSWDENFAVIGAGTGLGVGIGHYDKNKHLHVALPSEGGHIDFAPSDDLEYELLKYIKENCQSSKENHPDMESVVSGKGIDNILSFFLSREKEKSPILKEIESMQGVERLQKMQDNYDNELVCKNTIDLFIKLYARACRNLAFMTEPYFGMLIVGSLAKKYSSFINSKEFIEEFLKHDKERDLLEKIPIHIVTNENVSLLGCANVAVNFFYI
jgi:glucokinase